MKLALTDSGREYMMRAYTTDFDSDHPDDMEDAANILSLFETFGPVIEADMVYEYARQETDKKDSYMDWKEEPLKREYINRIVKRLFEARYLEQVQEYDEDNILMTLNPAAIPLEKAKEMHQEAKWARMKREYRMDNYGEY